MPDLPRRLEVRFETAPQLPPPFCYYYQLVLTQEGDPQNVTWQASLVWKYHHREQLTQAELEEEGFSGAENVEWEGIVPTPLARVLPIQTRGLRLLPAPSAPSDTTNYFWLSYRLPDGSTHEGIPDKQANWEYLVQEVIQGLYEVAGREAPLHIQLLRYNEKAKKADEATLSISFAKREAQLTRSGLDDVFFSDWEQLQGWIQDIFSMQFDEVAARPKPPQRTGLYIETGDGYWYEWGRSAQATDTSEKSRLEALFEQLLPSSLTPHY